MDQLLAIVLVALLSIAAIVALLTVLEALFPRIVADGQQMANALSKRSFWFGLLNTLFLGIIAIVCIAISENGAGIFVIPALFVLGVGAAGIAFGLSALARIVGTRLLPQQSSSLKQMLGGATAMTLACLVPFVGWFGLLPLLAFWGGGGVALGVYRRWRPIKKG